VVGEDACPRLALHGVAEQGLEVVAVEDVIAEHERARLAIDELAAEDEGLRQAVWARLHDRFMPQREPSPSSDSKRGVSCGVLITSTSRMPASISVDSG
jgi:hypothetical protein